METDEKRPLLVIEPGLSGRLYWWDVWNYRELLYFLAWRDIVVRYKQTLIGASWAIIRPILTMVVFSVIFGKLANLPSGCAPYPILVFTALLPWQLFASALSDSGNSLVANSHLVSKVYFPRILIPVSSIAVSVVDFGASCAVLACMMGWYGYIPSTNVVYLPVFLAMACAVAIGLGTWLAALNVRYRDFRIIIPFIVQIGLYVSPVGFSSSVVPEKWRFLYAINPMVGVIDGFRWTIVGAENSFNQESFALSIVVTVFLLWGGIRYFRAAERSFVDVI